MSSNRAPRRPWTVDEDTIIIELVEKHGRSWSKIALDLEARRVSDRVRTGKQCRERWHNHLNPDVNKDPWSPGMSSGASLSVSSPRSLHFMLQRGTAVHSLH